MARTKEKRNTCRTEVRKYEGRRPIRGPRHRWCYNIKMALKEIVWGSMDWIHLSQDTDNSYAVVNTLKNFAGHKIGGRGIS